MSSARSQPDAQAPRLPPLSLPRPRAPALLLGLAALVLLSALPLAAAYDTHESNNVSGPGHYIYSGTTSSAGQKFIMTNPQFTYANMNRVAVWMDSTSTSGTVCLRFAQTGSGYTDSCKAASAIPSSAGYVEFTFSPTVSFNPTQYVEFYIDWTGTCTTCMRVYYTDSNVYRTSDSQSAMLTKDNGNAWIWPDRDLIFWSNIDHSPIMATDAATSVGSTSATLNGRNVEDSGTIANVYYQYGTTTSYGQTTSTTTCPQGSGGCARSVSGLAANTLYHFRICGSNGVGGTQCGSNQMFTTQPAPNNPPNAPTSPNPSSGATGVSVDTGLSWNANGGDPDGQTVTYSVYFDAGTTASTLRCTTTSTSCPNANLPRLVAGTQYAWRIVATDGVGGSTSAPSSGAWTFTTKASACSTSAAVILYEHANYDGGCIAFDAYNNSFPHATFSNGVNLNDAVSSVQVREGNWAILYLDTGFGGTPLVLSGHDSDLTDNGFGDKPSSLRPLKCDPNAKVVAFEHQDYTGGCRAFNSDDTDLSGDTFSNGALVNNQITSLWIKEGHQVTLFDLAGASGSSLVLLNRESSLVGEGFNDVPSALRIGGGGVAPGNNAHDRATPATDGYAYVYNARQPTSGATTQSGETLTCGGTSYGSTVWFKFTARNAGTARVTTWGSDFNTVVAAYEGTSLASPSKGCNNDAGGGTQSRLEFTCVKGQDYLVQVGGAGSATGNLVFQLSGCLNFPRDPFMPSGVNPACVSSGKRFEVLYARPNDVPNLYAERVERIREQVREMNAFLRQDAAMQGNRVADYKVKCTGGVIDVTSVALGVPHDGDVIGALKSLGYTNTDVKYIVWLEKRYDCGFGYALGTPSGNPALGHALDPANNPINGGPHWAVIDCDESPHGAAVMMHEVGHTMGAVHDDAPDSDKGGHCTDKRSMMCDYDGDTTGLPCPDLRYDCGFDSYFNPNPKASEDGVNRHWLFTHWNQAHPYNAYLQLAAGPTNDNFASRTTIASAPSTQTVSTAFATHEAILPWSEAAPVEHSTASCGWQTNTVWYQYTPAASGTLTVTTSGSNFDTTLAAFTGSSLGSLSLVQCNNNAPGGGTHSQVSFGVSAGTAYILQAGGANGAAGSLQVQLTCSPNNCAAGNQAPSTPSLSCSPNPSTPTQTVTCTFSSTDADSGGVFYTVNWGDGTANTRVPAIGTVVPGSSQSAGHSYTGVGSYTISVTATDNGSPAATSGAATHTQTVQLVANAPPGTPSLSCSPNPSTTGQTVTCTFSSTDTDSTGVYYTVGWGDGTASTRVPATGTALPGMSQSAGHSYAAAGTFTISVTATDNGSPPGTSGAATRSQTVTTSSSGLPYSQGFDGGSASGWSLTGLWHVTNCRSFGAPNSLGYNKAGCPTNFDTGATTAGSAVTPSLTLPSGSSPHLKWQSWHQTESGTTWDKKTVSISTNGGVSWTQLWQEAGTQSTWNARDVDISAYAGSTVQVRFHFDSVDAGINGGEGWYVDNVVVESPTLTVPSAPQSPNAVAGPGVGQIQVTWSAPASNGGSAITGYKVYRATSCTGTFSLIGTVGASTFSYTDGSLGNGAFRCYKISATNSVGEGPQSAGVGATTWTTPGAPRSLDASPGPGIGEIRLTWLAPTSNGGTAITSYKVYRATGSGGAFAHVATVGGSTLAYTDSGLTALQAYYYYVTAVNAVGEGAASNTDCAKPYPDPLGGC